MDESDEMLVEKTKDLEVGRKHVDRGGGTPEKRYSVRVKQEWVPDYYDKHVDETGFCG